jgi:CubicO group peptidase (beta-lactamase class C family)
MKPVAVVRLYSFILINPLLFSVFSGGKRAIGKYRTKSSNLKNTFLHLCHGIVLLFSFCFIFGCNSGNTTSAAVAGDTPADSVITIDLPAPAPISAELAARLKAACQAFYDTILLPKGFNGGIIVAKNGNIVFEKYNGTAFVNGFDTIHAGTPFHIASVTKTFTAMAVLKLWEQGKLNIDDEVSRYIPGFNYPGVTVRTLLNHRSGLPNYIHFLQPMGWDITKHVSNEDVVNFLITRKAEMENTWPANIKFSYCNTNYVVLAVLIEKVSGKTYSQFLQQQFFTPLKMTNSRVFSLADTLTTPPSFDWKGRLIPFNFLDAAYGDKNIYTTPRDLMLWDRALNSGKLFTPETLVQAYAPYSNEKPGVKNYGLGWRMNIYPNNKKIIFHNGWWHGNNAVFIRLLEDSATIIVVGNKFTRAIYSANQLANLFGDYNIPEEEDEQEGAKTTDSLSLPGLRPDTLLLKKPRMNKKDSALHRLFKDKHKEAFEQQSLKMQ